MLRIYKQVCIPALVFILGSCTKNFTKLNTDPNTATTVSPPYLLSTILINTAYNYQSDAFIGKPAEAGRYITKVRNEGDDKFGWSASGWDSYYQQLSRGKQMYDLANAAGMTQYMAISKIMRVFNFAYITDLFGDCPYTQALLSKDSGIVHPRYDRQSDIYPDLLKTLVEANTMLSQASLSIDKNYDVLYAGSALQWRQFANALRLRLLLRISRKYPQAFADMQTILNDNATYPIFKSNADNAELKYLGKTSFDSWQGGNLANTTTEIDKYKPSKQLVDTLLSKNDPRLPVWVAEVDSTTKYTVDGNLYVGVPNAIPSPYNYNGGDAHISRLGAIFYQNVNSMVNASMMTYAEQCFILAEAAQAGKLSVPGETAASLYYKGINASLSYYGISSTAQQTYTQQANVVYDGTLNQLITQKWIANFLKGPEGWFDHRRTGLPVFVLGPLSVLPDVPSRYIYSINEQSYNLDQYKLAVSNQGPDVTTTLMWYLK
jgi:hypothetical protein